MKKELTTYLFVGISAVAVDYISYLVFVNFLPFFLSKTLSYIAGMIVAFVCNRHFTFKSTSKIHHDAARFLVVYISSLVLNVVVNQGVLFFTDNMVTVAFLFATGVSIITNYLGQKLFVFKRP